MQVRRFADGDLPQLQRLVNLHLSSVIPGWALSEAGLARHLQRNDAEPVTDPWIEERTTLVATEGYRVLAAAHLLRFGGRPEIGASYRNVGEITWFLAQPERTDIAAVLLTAAEEQMTRWNVRLVHGWGTGLPAGPLWGVPDSWPHITAALEDAGYRVTDVGHAEALYGGWLGSSEPAAGAPPTGLTLRRRVGAYETRLAVFAGEQEVGYCEIQPDLTQGGLSPALSGWAWLTNLEVEEGRRNQGIGTWLVRQGVAWLRLAGCNRIVFSVDDAREAAGAGRFYRRFGWDVLARETHGWIKE